MCKETTAMRLKQIMEERNLRQIDILNMVKPFCEKYHVKMNRSDISQYCSGKVEPHQEKLFILGNAIGVSEAWLMGFNVPRERKSSEDAEGFGVEAAVWNVTHPYTLKLSQYEFDIIKKIRKLDDYGKRALDAVLDVEYERCIEEEENTIELTDEEIERLKLEKYLKGSQELLVARKVKK